MTLFKQMGLTISIIIIIMLSAVMVINYQSTKNDMVQSLYETTVNNISTLTNKLAAASSDPAMLVTTIDSEFDSGYYKMIDFKSNDGKTDYKQVDNKPIKDVPAWFVKLTSIELPPVTADVSSGWSMIGTVSVASDTSVVYKALYKMFIKLSYIFIVSLTIAHIALYAMLHFILKPLYRVQHQAESILKNRFIIQKKVPFTTEFKDVVKGMNAMVTKVEDIFRKGEEAAQRNHELLYNDPITKLFNRRYLMLKLPDLVNIENSAHGGAMILLAIKGAEVINQTLGRQKTDALFLELGTIFNDVSKESEERVIARVNGTEFAIVLPNCDTDGANIIANKIKRAVTLLWTRNELDHTKVYISMGIYVYKPSVSVESLLTRADNALSIAISKEDENIHIYKDEDDENAMGKEQWRTIIEESIDKNFFSLKFWPTLNVKTKEVNHKVMTFTIDGGENKKYLYGDFIAPAINLGLISKIYMVALKDLITKNHDELKGSNCSIRLSNEFIKDHHSFHELYGLFEKHAKKLNFKLSFEVSDSFAINNRVVLKTFVALFSKYDFGFGINSFTGESEGYNYLKELNPDFLKADCAFLLDQSEDSMSALQVITDSLGIEIIATFVKTQEELEKLQKMHIYHVQGPITDTIK